MKKVIILIVSALIILGAVLLFFRIKHNLNAKQKDKYPTVQVSYGNIEIKILATGTIKPYTRVEIKSPVGGRIDEIRVKEGDKVRKDAVLALVSSDERISLITSAESDLAEAKKSGDAKAIEDAQKSYGMVKEFYRPVPINASIPGEIIKRDYEPGQIISAGTVVLVMSDKLVASVEVDEADIGKINVGSPAKITLDAFSEQELAGTIVEISHESRTVSNVTIYDVMVVPDSIPTSWRSGMTANVEFIIQSRQNVLTVPVSMIEKKKDIPFGDAKQGTEKKRFSHNKNNFGTREKNNKFVLVLENGKPVTRDVKTGISDGSNIEIIDGLKEGEEVIFNTESSSSSSNNKSSRSRQMMRMMPH
ncbi:MAG: efflux RND transporter periplasmic adaptor subunit [bacterium]